MATDMARSVEKPALDGERQRLLAHIAGLYYEQGLSQEEIAHIVKFSRSAVSRMLAEARECGVVEIRVHHPIIRSTSLEEALTDRFETLQTARVCRCTSMTYPQALRHLGAQAAQYLGSLLDDGTTLGVSWGTAVYEVANALHPPAHYPNLTVVQLIGALNSINPEIDGPELARRIAWSYGGRYQLLPAPLIVDSRAMRDGLMNDRRVRQVLERAQLADVALVGIGTVDPEMSSLIRAGFLTTYELSQIAARGAVGDVCGIHFDEDGNILDIPVNQRVVGIPAGDLKRIPIVVGLAAGQSKSRPILGALRAGLVNTLFTDETTAHDIVNMVSG
jgi:deoxyribonucleoside regulator